MAEQFYAMCGATLHCPVGCARCSRRSANAMRQETINLYEREIEEVETALAAIAANFDVNLI